MLTIQIVGFIGILLILVIVLSRFKKKQLSLFEFISWTILWIFLGLLAIFPSLMMDLARLLGVGRGVDVIIYIALFLIFYLIFKINIRMEKMDQDITKIVKEVALREIKKK